MKSIISLLLLFSFSAHGETVWDYVDKKLEKKKFKRWSLSSWFYDKRKYALQDQWLALNTDNDGIFWEFYVDYAKSTFDVDTANNQNIATDGFSGEAAIYMSLLGLTYRHEEYDTHYSTKDGSVSLRLIGTSHQATHLILHYGKREFIGVNETEEFEQSFYGGDISLYLLPWLGFDGRHRRYLRQRGHAEIYELESIRTQWGAFIDIGWLRIFAYQFEENFKFTRLLLNQDEKRQTKGTAAGIRLYF